MPSSEQLNAKHPPFTSQQHDTRNTRQKQPGPGCAAVATCPWPLDTTALVGAPATDAGCDNDIS